MNPETATLADFQKFNNDNGWFTPDLVNYTASNGQTYYFSSESLFSEIDAAIRTEYLTNYIKNTRVNQDE